MQHKITTQPNKQIQKKKNLNQTRLDFPFFTPLVNLPRLFRLFSLIAGSFGQVLLFFCFSLCEPFSFALSVPFSFYSSMPISISIVVPVPVMTLL